jgi:hypothetical protein
MPYSCNICAEESMRICVRCTKDACDNHICDRCRRCSDCCECEIALDAGPRESVRPVVREAISPPHPAPIPDPEPEPEPALPEPDPDPAPFPGETDPVAP